MRYRLLGDVLTSAVLKVIWCMAIVLQRNILSTQAFQHGAPMAACDTMLPDMTYYGGHSSMPNQSDSPYEIQAFDHLSHITYEYTPGSRMAITVQVRGPIFRGFMLQARTLHGAGNRRIGQFVPPLPMGTKFLHCDPHLSHKSGDSSATVVADRQTYWTNIMSPVLHPFTNKIFVATDTCGIGFGCIQAGQDGCSSTNTCDYTIRWKCHGDQTFFDFVANKTHEFVRYVNVDAPSDAFLGLSWKGNSLLCRYSLANNGSRTVTANNYFMPDTNDEVFVDPFNNPRSTKLKHTSDGRYQCSFQRKNLMFQEHERVYFTYGTITQDGWIASIRKIDLGLYGVDSQVRLCKHPNLALDLPKAIASAQNTASLPQSPHSSLIASLVFILLIGWTTTHNFPLIYSGIFLFALIT